jgi:hypothetical protein
MRKWWCDGGGGEMKVLVVVEEEMVAAVVRRRWWLKWLDDIASELLFVKYFIKFHELKISCSK